MTARLWFVLLSVTMLCGIGSAQQAPAPDTLHRLQNANARLGAVNVVLVWNTEDDLDIRALCPNGEQIAYQTKQGCGGMLDVDQNAGANRTKCPRREHRLTIARRRDLPGGGRSIQRHPTGRIQGPTAD